MAETTRPIVIDADGHITEPPMVWSDYIEPAYRERAPHPTLDEHGKPVMIVDGRPAMRHAMLLTLGPDYAVGDYHPQAGGWDPEARLRDMDSEGIDVAVLFPSIGLYVGEVTDAALMAALCRAYNNWLADYCRHARGPPRRRRDAAARRRGRIDPRVDACRRATRLSRCLLSGPTRTRAGRSTTRTTRHSGSAPPRSASRSPSTRALSDWMPTLGRERFDNPAMLHVLSHPFEQMSACAGLILTGVLDRHPTLEASPSSNPDPAGCRTGSHASIRTGRPGASCCRRCA